MEKFPANQINFLLQYFMRLPESNFDRNWKSPAKIAFRNFNLE